MADTEEDLKVSENIDQLNDEIISLLSFDPEQDDGDTEYKRMLVGKDKFRLDELETQMRYRMEEGHGQCTYVIGIEDDGRPFGLTDSECEETHKTLEKLAKRNDYSLRLLVENTCKRKLGDGNIIDGKIREYLIRENNTVDYEEVKIAVAGNVDSSKSSTIGVLVTGKLDNGRGSARLSVLNFKHEVDSGRTSSISQQILGYDPEGNIVNHDSSIKKLSWPEISSRSSKIIKFFDLAGHTRYSKTTIRGMLSNSVDYAFITIASNMGPRGTTKEHISVCMTLGIPIILLLTKIDIGEKTPVMEETLNQIKKIFSTPGMRKMIYHVNDMNDVVNISRSVQTGDIIPLFKTSNTRGDGLNLIHEFLNMVRPRIEFDKDSSVEFHIDETFMPKGIGLVLGGFLKKGVIRVDKEYYLGPIDGNYQKVKCRSIHVNRSIVQEATPGRYVCIAVPKVERKKVKKGMVLLGNKNMCRSVKSFTAEIIVYRTHHTTIRVGYETMVHVNSLRAVVKLVKIVNKKKVNLKKSREEIRNTSESSDDVLSLKDRATIILKFPHRSCYLNVGDRILLAETQVKMTGIVKEIDVI